MPAWRGLPLRLLAAACLLLAAPAAWAGRATPLFETQQIHESFPTGLALVDLRGKPWLVTIAWDGWLKLWNADDGTPGPKVKLSERRLHRLAVTPAGVAVVAGDDGMFVYDLTRMQLFAHYFGGVALHHVTVHPSLPVAFGADSSGRVHAANLTAGPAGTWPTLGRSLTYFGVTLDGETLITTDSRTVKLWNSATGDLTREYDPLSELEPIAAVVFRVDSGVLYLGSGNQVTAVELLSGQRLTRLTVSETLLVGLYPGATPGELLVASRGGEVTLWDFDLGQAKVALASEGDEGYTQWAFTPDHRKAFALMPIISRLKAWKIDP